MNKIPNNFFFKGANKGGFMSNNKFWSIVKPFQTNEGCISNNFINGGKDGDVINNEKQLVKLLDQNYKNISKNSSETFLTSRLLTCFYKLE